MECPSCKKEIRSVMYTQDGGSRGCEHCGIKFHKCVGGVIKYGSPGPSMCPFCRYTICPKCNNQTFAHNFTKDGSTICQHCKINFHSCLGNTIKFGSPGPSNCAFCPLKEIS